MTASLTTKTPDEVGRLGEEILAREIYPTLEPADEGKFIALDVVSGDYELDEDDYAAVSRLRARRTSRGIWLGRVGEPAAYRMR